MQEYIIEVPEEDSGKRLDVFLINFAQSRKLGFSRTFLQAIINAGKVSVDGKAVIKPHRKIKGGEKLRVEVEEKKPCAIQAEGIDLTIVYEDDDLAVINKPCGLVVHPAPGNREHTLANALIYHFKNLSDINPERPGIVHRLDKDTSGLLVIAKNNPAHLSLARQFSEHSIKRKYIALVRGKMEFDEHIIEMPIGRHPQKRESMSVGFGKNSRYAKTYYRTLKRSAVYSLLELEPFTGRTHQLRVHLAFLGHPILGDKKYSRNNDFSRMALHAKYIGFVHPSTGRFTEFESDIPQEFKDFADKFIAQH
jgi:23S rRNA pseudouridine1911/1915/1917 synthase